MPAGREPSKEERLLSLASTLWSDIVTQPLPASAGKLWKEHLNIRSILDKMGELNPPAAMFADRSSRMEEAERFIRWCETSGIEAVRLTLANFGDGPEEMLGLKALAEISEGDSLLKVPLKAILSPDVARKLPSLHKAMSKDPMLRGMDNVALALCLACEYLIGKKSNWYPYIRMLPANFSTPLFFTQEELVALRPSAIFESALKMFRHTARQFVYFLLLLAPARSQDDGGSGGILGIARDKAPEPATADRLLDSSPLTLSNFTFDLYKWAVAAVTTRLNLIPSQFVVQPNGSPAQMPALIPFLDMANHQTSEDVDKEKLSVNYCPVTKRAGCSATADYVFGQQVTIFYGMRSNGDHLLHNGFIPEANDNDYVGIRLGLSKTEEHYEKRVSILRKMGLELNQTFEVKRGKEPVSDAMFRFGRVFVAGPTDLADEVVDTEAIRCNAWSFMRDRFQVLVARYMGAETACADGTTANLQLVRLLLEQEREIINNALQYCTRKVAILQSAAAGKEVAAERTTDDCGAAKFREFESLD